MQRGPRSAPPDTSGAGVWGPLPGGQPGKSAYVPPGPDPGHCKQKPNSAPPGSEDSARAQVPSRLCGGLPGSPAQRSGSAVVWAPPAPYSLLAPRPPSGSPPHSRVIPRTRASPHLGALAVVQSPSGGTAWVDCLPLNPERGPAWMGSPSPSCSPAGAGFLGLQGPQGRRREGLGPAETSPARGTLTEGSYTRYHSDF